MKLVWIQTQDGSPTLWNNELGEPYRSVKGAFHESLKVFVKPAIEHAEALLKKNPHKKEIIIGEFGLGAGSNWMLFSLLAGFKEIPFRYVAIESDPTAFNMALEKWPKEGAAVQKSILEHCEIELDSEFSMLDLPEIYPSIEDLPEALKVDVWFHDPFGFSVNPDGYSLATLKQCSHYWGEDFIGLSYACNTAFKSVLNELGLKTQNIELKSPPLKKEALSFYW